MADLPRSPLVPVSWGEVLDKITILEIKAELIGDSGARANVTRELRRLEEIASAARVVSGVAPLVVRLKAANQTLWGVEDAIREREAAGDFGSEFIELARTVYRTNDLRAALKRELNAVLGSEYVEEKCYAGSGGQRALA
jgi:hypothetical protein